MNPVVVDATTLIALGRVGELDLLSNFDGRLVAATRVRREVTTEPASTNLDGFCETTCEVSEPEDPYLQEARSIMDEAVVTGDVAVIGHVLMHTDGNSDENVAVVSDDRRVRTIAEGLGADVTGTVGVVVRAVHEGMAPETAKDLIRRLDDHGLHMTGELRETAYRLVEDAAEERD
jgi:predicted nucleic acid-binding protein